MASARLASLRLGALAALGGVAILLGSYLVANYLRLSDPSQLIAGTMQTTGIVTSQSQGLVEAQSWRGGERPSTVAQYLTFTFTDASGMLRGVKDEVSAPFYESHPVGTQVDVYYFPDAPALAITGNRLRLVSTMTRDAGRPLSDRFRGVGIGMDGQQLGEEPSRLRDLRNLTLSARIDLLHSPHRAITPIEQQHRHDHDPIRHLPETLA